FQAVEPLDLLCKLFQQTLLILLSHLKLNYKECSIYNKPFTQKLMDNIFQGIGVLRGQIIEEKHEEKLLFYISIKTPNITKKYQLFFTPRYRNSFHALKLQIKNNTYSQRVIVYPRVLHLPFKDKPHQVRFQLVGFDNGSNQGLAELADFEFKLAGKWQFIAGCKTPVISIYRNFTQAHFEYYKSLDQHKRKLFASPSHIPLLWKNAPVTPFRFNPKLEKHQQGETFFVKIKAKFLPDKDLFGFDNLVALPTTDSPKFIKFKNKTVKHKTENKKIRKKLKPEQPITSK
ncbi:MAG: hypothetical protein AAF349_28610, partial [Cyanobacteria bacterium P01_A01_bin.68]